MNYIYIDTEYFCNRNRIERVYCAATNYNGNIKAFDLRAYSKAKPYPSFLDMVKRVYGIEDNVVFVGHCIDLAEIQAMLCIGVDPLSYTWSDTYYNEKYLCNSMDRGAIGFSLLDLESRYVGVDRVTDKEEMRRLCITGQVTEDNINDVMEYCAEDVVHLPRIHAAQLGILRGRLTEYDTLFGHHNAPPAEEVFLRVGAYVKRCGVIASRGIPVHDFEEMQKNAERMLVEEYTALTDTWGAVEGKGSRDVVQSLLSKEIEELGFRYPKTESGLLRTDGETLKRFFGGLHGSFGNDYMHYKTLRQQVSSVASGKWCEGYSSRLSRIFYKSLRPYGALTGRNQPKISDGFIFGWSKKRFSKYVGYKEGDARICFEIDFGAQETFIAAEAFQYDVWRRMYDSKDIYLALAVEMGAVPRDDFEAMSKEELKEKYESVRKLCKILLLSSQYGAGKGSITAKMKAAGGVDVEALYESFSRIRDPLKTAQSLKVKEDISKGIVATEDVHFAWTVKDKALTVRNFPMQANGAAILRLSLCLLERADLLKYVVATVHDAVVFDVPKSEWEEIRDKATECMIEAAGKICHTKRRIKTACEVLGG